MHTKTKPDLILKNWWVLLPITEATEVRSAILKSCKWDRHQWHARLHGKTSVAHLEQLAINQVAENFILSKPYEI